MAQIKKYAETKIEEKDAERMKCSMIREVDSLCRVISNRECDISQSKIYAAMVVSGMNIRYHDMKNDNQDVLYELGDDVSRCVDTYDRELMEFTEHNDTLFSGANSKTMRFESTIVGRTKKSAKCGVRLADINLYNALAGVERFDEENPMYLPKAGRWVMDDCLTVFRGAKRKLGFRDMGLKCILNHKDEMGQ